MDHYFICFLNQLRLLHIDGALCLRNSKHKITSKISSDLDLEASLEESCLNVIFWDLADAREFDVDTNLRLMHYQTLPVSSLKAYLAIDSNIYVFAVSSTLVGLTLS